MAQIICPKCGQQVPDNVAQCPFCGAPLQAAAPGVPAQPKAMSFGEAVGSAFKNLFNFSGRARRTEFWWFYLVVGVIGGVVGAILHAAFYPNMEEIQQQAMANMDLNNLDASINAAQSAIQAKILPYFIANCVWAVILTVLALGVSFRRLQDIGKAGAMSLIFFIPYLLVTFTGYNGATWLRIVLYIWEIVAAIMMLIWTVKKGNVGPNKFGPDPKF
jgi:uncharacterized membrane protein YhaH (DUF805 family)